VIDRLSSIPSGNLNQKNLPKMFNSMHDKTRQSRRELGRLCQDASIEYALSQPSKAQIMAELAEAVRNTAAMQEKDMVQSNMERVDSGLRSTFR
jgi:hypothetical protein